MSKDIESPQDVDPPLQKFKMPMRFKVSLGITCFVLLAIVPVFYILMKYYEPDVKVIHKTEISMPGGSVFGMAKIQLVDKNLIGDADIDYQMFITYPIEDNQGRNLQQMGSKNFFLHNIDMEKGITIRMSPMGNTSFFVNENQFLDYATMKAAEEDPNAAKNSKKMDDKIFYTELGYVFTKALEDSTGEKNIEVKFTNLTMAKLKINANSRSMEFDLEADTGRKLFERPSRELFLGSILSVATKIVPKVAGFFVNTVRKYGPLIGKVAGGIIGGVGGFFVGGPAGAFQGAMTGMKIGEMVGSAASSLVNACIPQGSLRISCTPSSIGSVFSQFGGSFSGMAGGFQPGGGGQGGVDFSSMFGGGKGNIMGGIPSKALSFFGLGSIFG